MMRTGHDPVSSCFRNRQGKARLAKHHAPPEDSEKHALELEHYTDKDSFRTTGTTCPIGEEQVIEITLHIKG